MPLLPHGPVPSPAQLAWHRRPLYGFVHYGLNAWTGREWGWGDEDPALFAPGSLDTAQWVAAAKAGGLSGLILTAKHHDGFCLWPTATTAHSIAASPWRRGKGDLVGELAAMCRAAGLRFGIYCSPWDRSHPDYGSPAYVACWRAQLEELLTRYGDIFEIWFDGANGGDGAYGGKPGARRIDRASYYGFAETWARCRELQPQAVIFSDAGPDLRWVGNEDGFASTTNWSRVRPEGFAVGQVEDMARLAHGDPDGTHWRPAEVDVSIRKGWFWHADEAPRSADGLFDVWLRSVGRGAGLNLNLPPDTRGLIPEADVAALAGFRRRVEAFTAVDLARGRLPTVSPANPEADPAALTDGRDDTCWWAAADARSATIDIRFDTWRPVGGVRIDEAIAYGQRIQAFAIDILRGSAWIEVATGTTIGAQCILVLDGTPANGIRLRINAAQAAPAISRLEAYASGGASNW